ncbi:L-asparaginase, partial [Tremellales sp. Uapishka_1]
MTSPRPLSPSASSSKSSTVLVLGTGGTIASEPTPEGFTPLRNQNFFRRIRRHPQLSDNFSSESTPVSAQPAGECLRYPRLRTPELDDEGSQVSYDILDLASHKDSSEMTTNDWNKIAALITAYYGDYDGFIILSGTDTLAYTASILSFLFADAGKPIVVTGAQIPLSQPRSDGWTNILESLLVAGLLPYSGVGIVFHHQVFRGCRATKVSPNLLSGFNSPCHPPLIKLDVKILCDSSLVPRSLTQPQPLVSLLTEPTVLSCSIYPGITGSILSAQFAAMPTCRAVILSAFGSGNLPVTPESGVLEALIKAVENEILVVVLSQYEDVDANDMIYPELHAALLRSTQAQGTSPPTSRCSQFPTKDIEKHLNDKKEGLWRKLRRHYHDEDYDTGKSLAKGLETFINSQPTFHCIEAPYLIVKYVADAETFKKCQTRGETVDVRTLRGRGSEKAGE